MAKSKIPAAADGCIVMKAPEGASAPSVGGKTLELKGGFAQVPVESAADLMSHGYVVAGEDADAAEEASQPAPETQKPAEPEAK